MAAEIDELENDDRSRRFNINLNLSGEYANLFSKIKNRSSYCSEMIKKSFDCRLASINVSDEILEKYKADINRPFLVDVLLTSYYNGDLDCNSLSVIRNKGNDLGKAEIVREEYSKENITVSEEAIVKQDHIVEEIAIDEVEPKTDRVVTDNQIVEDVKEEVVEATVKDKIEEVKTAENETTINKGKLNIGHSAKPKVSLAGLNLNNIPKT